ncbi:hypothetical protein Golax_015646 [Gossypium laxum]|uniref:Uncharacterized protein n=1 Tax=Gossypium laxum TaxID=34288 RepID=A0A7J8YUV0_9ROSI|nr:hypothetical protein [Gossypium laxum]
MESGSTSNNNESRIAFKEGSWFGQFKNGSNPWMARYVYGLIFLASYLLAWAVRDYGRNAFPEMERLENCQGGRGCLGAEGVLRRHMAFRMVVLQDRSLDCLDDIDGLNTCFPVARVGEIAHFGAGVFLLVQLVSVISFITWLNDCCQSDKTEDKCEPAGENCIRKAEASNRTDWLTIISFIVALLAMVIATFSTGIDSQCFQVKKEAPAEDAMDDRCRLDKYLGEDSERMASVWMLVAPVILLRCRQTNESA